MSLVSIAWKSLCQRALASSLTALSIALGVAMLIAVLILIGIFGRMFSQTGAGYDLLVGPRGSETQLVLSAIYRIEKPIENLPYRYYKELREDPRVAKAVPIAIGDTTQYGNFPIVGTTARYFTLPAAYSRRGPVDFLLRGDVLKAPLDAVIGSEVAATNGWDIGDVFYLLHSGVDEHVHKEAPFTVRGVLEPTGTPNDRTAFVSLSGFLELDGHGKTWQESVRDIAIFFDEDEETIYEANREAIEELVPHGKHYHREDGLPDFMKEVSAVLVVTKDDPDNAFAQQLNTRSLAQSIKTQQRAQAVSPVSVMKKLSGQLLEPIDLATKCVAGVIIFVTGVSVFVSIYNSMSERRREIGIMRALGASRGKVMSIILMESALLCGVGGLLGLLLGHGLVFLAQPLMASRANLLIDPLAFEPFELLVIPILLVLGVIVGILPGLTAYRTDVATALEA